MSTHNVVSVESPHNVTADMDDVRSGASAEHPESGPRVVRVSLFGCSIEIVEGKNRMPFSILGC